MRRAIGIDFGGGIFVTVDFGWSFVAFSCRLILGFCLHHLVLIPKLNLYRDFGTNMLD